MSVFNSFDDTLCIIYDNDIKSVDVFLDLNIPVRFFDNIYSHFEAHINVIKYAKGNKYNCIIVFENNILPLPCYKESIISDILDSTKYESWDVIYLSRDVFGNPITNAIIYNKTSFDKILLDYNDYIDLIDYNTYITEYINLNAFISSKYVFTNDTIVNRIINNEDIINFFYKYYGLFLLCIITYWIKIYVKRKRLSYINRKYILI